MKRHSLSLLLLLFLLSSCGEKDLPAPLTDCVDDVLKANDMIPYKDGDPLPSSCYSHLHEYTYKGDTYFVWGNVCIDMIAVPFDCDNTPLCDIEENYDPCTEFFKEAKLIGMVGISED